MTIGLSFLPRATRLPRRSRLADTHGQYNGCRETLLASPRQTGPYGVCMRGRRTKDSCRSRLSTISCCWIGRGGNFADRRGAIPDHLAPIVDRLGINRSNWVDTVRSFGRLFKQAAGRPSSLIDAAAQRSWRWFQGKAAARIAFV